MLDLRFVRENLDEVTAAIESQHSSFDKDLFAKLDEERRQAIMVEEALQAERNTISKEIGKLMGQKLPRSKTSFPRQPPRARPSTRS